MLIIGHKSSHVGGDHQTMSHPRATLHSAIFTHAYHRDHQTMGHLQATLHSAIFTHAYHRT